jgi:hypothetical protein
MDSILGIAVVAAFALMFYAFTTRQKIWNLFASAMFIFIATQLSEYVAFLIVAVGLALFLLINAFFGKDI